MDQDETIRAAQILGASVGAFLSSIVTTLPTMLDQLAKSSSSPDEPAGQIARWAQEVSRYLANTLNTKLPPEEAGRMIENLVTSTKSLLNLISEVSKIIGDPQLSEVLRRTIDGFRKSLTMLSSSDPMAIMKAMSDPDIIYAIGVVLSLLKALGVAIRISGNQIINSIDTSQKS